MLYVKMQDGRAVSAQAEYPGNDAYCGPENRGKWETRNDWHTFERAQQVARELTESTRTLETILAQSWTHYIATDSGPDCSPRYDVISAPRVGDLVSKSFNGDSYPVGKITSVSASLKVVTATDDDGRVTTFYRKRETGSWVNARTWFLCAGHIIERNPEF